MTLAAQPQTDDPIPTRYSLLSRLKNWADQDSWKEFFDTYWRLIYSIARRSGLSASEAEDVVQETVICVTRDIHKFKRDRVLGSFKGWLRNTIRWKIADQYRKRRGPRRPRETTEEDLELPDFRNPPDGADLPLELQWQAEWREHLFNAAVDRIKRRIKEEHFQIFHFSVMKGWPPFKVSRAMSVGVGSVYLVRYRVAALVKREIQKLEAMQL